MKFNRVDDDKLQIILNKEDLSKRNIKKWDLLPYSPAAHRIFQEILDEAYEECGFTVENNTQLMIEAFPITGESLLITVTKIADSFREDLEQELLNLTNRLLETEEEDSLEIVDDVIYRFRDLEDVIQLAKALNDPEINSVLYGFGENYYLYLPNSPLADNEIYSHLDEYGDEMQLAYDFLEEHGKVIIKENALKILASL